MQSDGLVREIDGFFAIRDGVTVPLLDGLRELDSRELYREDGAASAEDWLTFRRGCSPRTARELLTVARALGDLPRLREVLLEGSLSWDKAVLIAGVATADDESWWLDEAGRCSYARLEWLVQSGRRIKRDEVEAKLWERGVWFSKGRQGFTRIRGRLPEAEGALVRRAFDNILDHMGPDRPDGTYNVERIRNADALIELASTRIAQDAEPDRATVVVHVGITEINKIHGTAVLEDGGLLGAEIARRLACDSRLQTVIDSPNGETIAVGTTMRTVPRWMRRLLMKRDKHCRFAGCTRTRGLHAHHIIHFAHGGPTVLGNLVMLCPYHHRLVHDGGWRILLDTQQRMRFIRPDGRPLDHRPVPLRPEVLERLFGPPTPKRGPGRQTVAIKPRQ
jgi:hypothetical protein